MQVKKILWSLLMLGVVSFVPATALLAETTTFDGNSNVNIWHHGGQAAQEMGSEQAKMARDRRLDTLVADPSDYKLDDGIAPEQQHPPKKHKKRAAPR